MAICTSMKELTWSLHRDLLWERNMRLVFKGDIFTVVELAQSVGSIGPGFYLYTKYWYYIGEDRLVKLRFNYWTQVLNRKLKELLCSL